MGIDLSDVELGFVANLKTLQRVLSVLSKNGRRWWVASDPRDAIDSGGILVGLSFTQAEGNFLLHDPIYIIDGLQRRAAALEVLKNGIQPKLGVMIHFGTTEPWERKRFELLNANRAKVSSNVLIRNLAPENSAIKMQKDLSLDSFFPRADRVPGTSG